MQCLEVSGAVRLIYRLLGVKGLISTSNQHVETSHPTRLRQNANQQSTNPQQTGLISQHEDKILLITINTFKIVHSSFVSNRF